MLDTVSKLLESPQVKKYRRLVIGAALGLLLLHVAAFLLALILPGNPSVENLKTFSFQLQGVTGGLLLIVILGAAVRALTDADQRWRSEAYDFIHKTLTEWFAASTSKDQSKALMDEIATRTYTDFKVRGLEQRIDLADGEIAKRFCDEIHFEFTFYPAKLIYGIHFESPSRELNESMCAEVRTVLRLDEKSGFVIDHQVPKKPAWIFLIRTVEISGSFEEAIPRVMTHARHFVELVFHSYDEIYNTAMAQRFQECNVERSMFSRAS